MLEDEVANRSPGNFGVSPEDSTIINSALRGFDRLSGLDEHQLEKLAGELELLRAPPGTSLLERGSTDSRLLFLLEGELELVAGDRASHRVRHTDAAAKGPVSRLRPSPYRVVTRTKVLYLLVEQGLLDSYSHEAPTASVLVEESFLASGPNDLIDDGATHPLMFDVFDDLNHGRIVVPSDPDVAVRVGRSLVQSGSDIVRLASILSACPALTLKVARAAKLAGPGLRPIHSCRQAIERLGTEDTLALAVHCVLRESLRSGSPVVRERMHSWWEQTMRVSAIAAALARMSGHLYPSYAALIGLLHAIAEPVLLGYADRHPDLADEAALDNVVHSNRAELGRILLTMWDMPREIVDAAARCNQWDYDHPRPADYTDITLVAQWHAKIGGARGRRIPGFEEIPAFRRVGLDAGSPELSLKIVEAAEDAIDQTESLLTG
ncbi:MAG: HDOD domain-containing protein [Sedimenticolaceae bacterium]